MSSTRKSWILAISAIAVIAFLLAVSLYWVLINTYPWLITGGPYSRKALFTNTVSCLTTPTSTVKTSDKHIALIQFNGDLAIGKPEINREKLHQLALNAVKKGADIIVFPEGGIHGYGDPIKGYWCADEPHEIIIADTATQCRDVREVAELLPGGLSEIMWSQFAKQHNVIVIYNLIEKLGDQYFNTLAVSDSNGFIKAHRKVKLMEEDRLFATAGSGATILETTVGRFGLMICNDTWFGTELYKAYEEAQVDGLIVSTYWNGYRPDRTQNTSKWHFSLVALEHKTKVFVSDNSYSDGTGLYEPCSFLEPERNGLALPAKDIDGISIHSL